MPHAASIFDEPTLTSAPLKPPPGPSRRVYRGRHIDLIEHKTRRELRIDGALVPVLVLGPHRFLSWALPGACYCSLEELGRAMIRAYYAMPPRARADDDVGSDSFELPED